MFARRRSSDSWWLAGAGAALSTWGVVLLYRSFDEHIDGPDGWPSVRRIFGSTFGSWLWVLVFGAVAGLLSLGVVTAAARGRRGSRTTIGTLGGAMVAMVFLGLLDSSISG